MSIRIGIIGGTGLGDVLASQMEPAGVRVHSMQSMATPFGQPGSAIVTGRYGEGPGTGPAAGVAAPGAAVDIAILQRHGEGHVLNPSSVPYRANIFALKQLGCTHILASGATGSLREEIAPGDLVICDQLIDRTCAGTGGRPRTFYERAAVHVEFADPMCPVMRQWLLDTAREMGADIPPPLSEGVRGRVNPADQSVRSTHPTDSGGPSPEVKGSTTVHQRGTYICIEGPSFSTRAESIMHRQWGADVVGMTALPEARLAREAEMAYALIALPTDYDCWRTAEQSTAEHAESAETEDDDVPPSANSAPAGTAVNLLEEIIANLNRATAASIALIRHALADVSILHETPSPAHRALDLAIWSDRSKVDPAEIERLRPLWGRHFD